MKKSILAIIIMFIFVGCESETVDHDTNELLEAKKKISDLDETNQKLNNRIIELETKIDRDNMNNYIKLEKYVDQLTQLEKFEYEILSEKIDRPPYDSVVYVANVPEKLNEQEIYVIRSAIQFAGKNFTKVSLWKDRSSAMKYIDGDYDPEEGVLGWSGFDQRFGFINNTSTPSSLRHSFSRDDGQVIEFGKYTYE